MKPFTLVGVDGNAFSVMGYVTNAMRTAGMSAAERDIYRSMAMSFMIMCLNWMVFLMVGFIGLKRM